VLAVGLVVLGVITTAARLDTPSDASVLRLGGSTWHVAGVAVDVPDAVAHDGLRPGDVVTSIAGHRLADGFGGVAQPRLGDNLVYDVDRGGDAQIVVRMERPDPLPLLNEGWGNLVFVFALAALAVALYLRRPEEPATTPLLILAAGLLGSTLTIVAGLPALALATGGPLLWLFHLNVIGAYSVAWGAALATSLLFVADHPWLKRRRGRVLAVAYLTPLSIMAVWTVTTAVLVANPLRWLGLVHTGQTAIAAATLVVVAVASLVAYRHASDQVMRDRLRWLGGGVAVAGLLSIAGWHLPELLTGRHALPSGALGLAALPFVAGIAVALRRHRLFDIERLANRSLVYAAVVALLVAGYAAMVALLVGGLRISGTVAAALAAAGAALALAPLRNAAQAAVNRVMYGDRTDPAGAIARLGGRLKAVMLPADVLPAVVETVAQSLRVPYAGIELADGAGGFRVAAEHGAAVGSVHAEPLQHHGEIVGRLLVSARGRDDPLDPVDLVLIGSLAEQVVAAVQAVRLHEDLVRSRAEVVALREDERRRLRRDLHDGLGPALAAIGLKAALARRDVPVDSTARGLLDEIQSEVSAGVADIRRLVEALRPPALDELGLVGAVRSRAAVMAGEMSIEVSGSVGGAPLPAAVETAAFRIAVEAMTNAVRHSGGRLCTVVIAVSDKGIQLAVRDDGGGVGPAHTVGLGLRSMSERAAEVGGVCSVGSSAEGGTLVHAWLPLEFGDRDDSADSRR
jgi:signal transduction histidine kinase